MLLAKTDILLPREGIDLSRWAVIACDQHTSEKEYWKELEDYIGEAPSTLRLMMPEAYLDGPDRTAEINAAMNDYLDRGIFRTIENTYIYVERTLGSGLVRKGLIGALDLNEYDYSPGSSPLIRATEGTVESRLPARVNIRKGAALEMPHAIVFTEENFPVEKGELLYDFDLNMSGGHIRGWKAEADLSKISRMAVGDGNHSLATAKLCGSESALVEIINIHDPAVVFEPIHRVVFGTDTSFLKEKVLHFSSVSECEQFCRSYIEKHGGTIDYIHNDSTALSMASNKGCFAAMLPAFDKGRLFDDVFTKGPYPKKSFSIGLADDKRYYLECRKIK